MNSSRKSGGSERTCAEGRVSAAGRMGEKPLWLAPNQTELRRQVYAIAEEMLQTATLGGGEMAR